MEENYRHRLDTGELVALLDDYLPPLDASTSTTQPPPPAAQTAGAGGARAAVPRGRGARRPSAAPASGAWLATGQRDAQRRPCHLQHTVSGLMASSDIRRPWPDKEISPHESGLRAHDRGKALTQSAYPTDPVAYRDH